MHVSHISGMPSPTKFHVSLIDTKRPTSPGDSTYAPTPSCIVPSGDFLRVAREQMRRDDGSSVPQAPIQRGTQGDRRQLPPKCATPELRLGLQLHLARCSAPVPTQARTEQPPRPSCIAVQASRASHIFAVFTDRSNAQSRSHFHCRI